MNVKIIGALFGLACAVGVQAQGVDQRHLNQQRRIDHGIASGRLTSREVAHDEHRQASIDRQEARMRGRDDGHLTGADRARLQQRENRASAQIYRTKHNGRGA